MLKCMQKIYTRSCRGTTNLEVKININWLINSLLLLQSNLTIEQNMHCILNPDGRIYFIHSEFLPFSSSFQFCLLQECFNFMHSSKPKWPINWKILTSLQIFIELTGNFSFSSDKKSLTLWPKECSKQLITSLINARPSMNTSNNHNWP